MAGPVVVRRALGQQRQHLLFAFGHLLVRTTVAAERSIGMDIAGRPHGGQRTVTTPRMSAGWNVHR